MSSGVPGKISPTISREISSMISPAIPPRASPWTFFRTSFRDSMRYFCWTSSKVFSMNSFRDSWEFIYEFLEFFSWIFLPVPRIVSPISQNIFLEDTPENFLHEFIEKLLQKFQWEFHHKLLQKTLQDFFSETPSGNFPGVPPEVLLESLSKKPFWHSQIFLKNSPGNCPRMLGEFLYNFKFLQNFIKEFSKDFSRNLFSFPQYSSAISQEWQNF